MERNLKEVNERNAALLAEERRRVMMWVRRRSCLDDDEVYTNALKPIAEAAFNAGHEVGFTEAMLKVDRQFKRATVSYWVALIASAACIAQWLSS